MKSIVTIFALCICLAPTGAKAYFIFDEKTLPADESKALPYSPLSSKNLQRREASLLVATALIIPQEWTFDILDKNKHQRQVSWVDGGNWRQSILEIARQVDCIASFQDVDHKLILNSILPTPHPPVLSESQPSTTLPQSQSPEVTTLLPVTESSPVSTPIWDLSPGSLHEQLGSWAGKAGYRIIWNAPHDLDMQADAHFQGEFLDVVQQLFRGLHQNGNAMRVTVYKANNVIEVSEE